MAIVSTTHVARGDGGQRGEAMDEEDPSLLAPFPIVIVPTDFVTLLHSHGGHGGRRVEGDLRKSIRRGSPSCPCLKCD